MKPTRVEPPSETCRIKRVARNAAYDLETIYPIIDEALICHVGITSEEGPVVIPMVHWRVENRLFIHGATSSRLMRQLAAGNPACITLTLVDGLVLARSAFHHSMNYRSVVLFGKGSAVEDEVQKGQYMQEFMEKICPGRNDQARPPSAQELKATQVIAFPIDQVSAKIRKGMPRDDAEDMGLGVWSGVVPLRLTAHPAQQDPDQSSDIVMPDNLKQPAVMAFPNAWD